MIHEHIDSKFVKSLNRIYSSPVELVRYDSPAKTSHDVYIVKFLLAGKEKTLVYKLYPNKYLTYKNPNLAKEVEVLRMHLSYGFVKVPKVVYFDKENNIFGRQFFVMEEIKGPGMNALVSTATSIKQKKGYVRDAADVISKIHSTPTADLKNIKENYFPSKLLRLFEYTYQTLLTNHVINRDESKLILCAINHLWKTRPEENENVLINGDLSLNHFILKDNNYYILDWDPADLGDRSWDLFWMIKDIPDIIFGYKDSLDDLVQYYEELNGRPLINKKFYSKAATIWAFILGWYIEKMVPDHDAVPLIKQCRTIFAGKIEDEILSK